MATYVAVPQGYGTLSAPLTPTVSDKISGGDIARGAVLEVNAGATPATATFVDPGLTPAGNTGTQAAVAVAAGATRRFKPSASFVSASTGLVTVTYSGTTSVTYELDY